MKMIDKKMILKELEEKFQEVKSELGFSATFEELDKIFFIKDAIFQAGFVSDRLDRQICGRISETLGSWNGYLHALIIPNPQNMINLNETKLFDEAGKKEIMNLIKGVAGFTSMNSLNGLTQDKKKMGEFVDGGLNFWKETLQPGLVKVMTKANDYWKS